MKTIVSGCPNDIARLVEAAAQGNQDAWRELLAIYRGPLRRTVEARMGRGGTGGVDASDVVQDAVVEAARRLPDYVRQAQPMPFPRWLRFLAEQQVLIVRRRLFARKRDPRREVSIHARANAGPRTEGTPVDLSDSLTGPSEVFLRSERKRSVRQALDSLKPDERRVLEMRNFELRSNKECAQALGISESAATRRYLRALERLREVLSTFPGGASDFRP